MRQTLIDIFHYHNFVSPESKREILFFEKSDSIDLEYFIVDFIESNELAHYLLSTRGTDLLTFFENKCKEKDDIEKNTSLILCVKVNSFAKEVPILSNHILNVEEDEYWFKKYVLIYSCDAVGQLSSVTGTLKDIILDNTRFNLFRNDIYADDLYYLAVQLYLKLPFLNVPESAVENYRPIEEIISQNLNTAEQLLLIKFRQNDVIFDSQYFDRLKIAALNPVQSDTFIDDFFKIFEKDNEA